MSEKPRWSRFVRAFSHFMFFFFIVSFVISCCTMLFVTVLSESLEVTLTEENVAAAAKLTFLNVVVISLIFTVADGIRRRFTVERPAKQIVTASEKMIAGDFNVRVKPVSKFMCDENFNKIIDCINQMAKELSGVETLRTDFVANVSHEMKTPLAVMQNYATLLQSEDLTEEQRREYARAISSACRHLSEMVSNVLKLSRLENQQIYPKTERYDLGEQLCECLLQYEGVWEKKRIEIETDIEDDVVITADRELLSHVWSNLFSNAFKFTPDGGRVSLTLKKEGNLAIVRVADTGIGISSQVGEHIFEKFYQADASHATKGNGLGLALVKRIIDITRAEISVESTLGKGSVFTVKLKTDGHETEKNM
ncbi:MAG: HAMP domain-containing histidine kinase [Ruminococcaceae bacterium]|nr:HAMP domain-containing histidine kinase [Oscillospiraceae bacterium]